MRICRTVVLLACISPASLALADDAFPYKANVTAENASVRGRPGTNYEPTDTLPRAAEVEVYRQDPDGWLAIRPPQGSLSWIPARALRVVPNRANVSEVTDERVSSYVGSRLNDAHQVSHVRLSRGELVEVLGEKRFASQPGNAAEAWCKISPPAGEFRWISSRDVTRQERAAPIAGAASAGSDTSPSTPATQVASYVAPSGAAAGPAAAVTTTALRPDATQAELDAISLQLSMTIAEPPLAWQLETLKGRIDSVLRSNPIEPLRSRAQALRREIEQYEAIRRQTAQIHDLRQQTDARNSVLAQAAAAQSTSDPAVDLTRFDGIGRLTPVVSKRPGAPRFALTDAKGGVVTFVTPDAELSLEPHVGHVVGLGGVRGYMPQLNKPHLTAKRLTELNPAVLR